MTPVSTMRPGRLARLEDWVAPYRPEFGRQDRLRFAALYLHGLLQPGGRKTIESLARSVADEAGTDADDLAQSLQHFLKQSPWDEAEVWHRHHGRLARGPDGGLLVLDELTFVKQGRHSPGVQRQLSRALGRKANCQIAVLLSQLRPNALVPLSLRLYLPRGWLRDEDRLDAAGVPEAARQSGDKLAIALALVDAARAAGVAADGVAAGPCLGAVPDEVVAELARRGLAWRGSLSDDESARVREAQNELCRERGLDHFEGRSWRGFHHHACLVTLAEAFRLLEGS